MLFPSLRLLAQRHLYRPEHDIDVVHDAFEKVLVYLNKKRDVKPTPRISPYILRRELMRACRRDNKYSVEMPSSMPQLYGQDDKTDF